MCVTKYFYFYFVVTLVTCPDGSGTVVRRSYHQAVVATVLNCVTGRYPLISPSPTLATRLFHRSISCEIDSVQCKLSDSADVN